MAVPAGQLSYGGGGGGNTPPTADFTTSQPSIPLTVPGNKVELHVDASASGDSDGDSLTYTWNWGDGSPTSSGITANHYYACTGNTVQPTVTLTVDDGHGNTASITKHPTLTSRDRDHDGLNCHQEAQQGTSDTRKDTDADGLSDYVESQWWPDRAAVFCHSSGSICSYPNPTKQDVYIEVDGWRSCNYDGTCDTYTMSGATRDALVQEFANHGVTLHVDKGNLGGGGQIITGWKESFDRANGGGGEWLAYGPSNSGQWRLTTCGSPHSGSHALGFTGGSCTYDGSGSTGDATFSASLVDSEIASMNFWTRWKLGPPGCYPSASLCRFKVATDTLSVDVSTDGGSTWTTLDSWDNANYQAQSWVQYSVSLQDYVGDTIQLRFHMVAADGTSTNLGWLIDDLQIQSNKKMVDSNAMTPLYHHNPNYFDGRRIGIFHQVMYLPGFYDRPTVCGFAPAPGDFVMVGVVRTQDGTCDVPGVKGTTLHELGHNMIGIIEPGSQMCSFTDAGTNDTTEAKWHDDSDYILSGHLCEYRYHGTSRQFGYGLDRWNELEASQPPGTNPGHVDPDLWNDAQGGYRMCYQAWYIKPDGTPYPDAGDLGQGVWEAWVAVHPEDCS